MKGVKKKYIIINVVKWRCEVQKHDVMEMIRMESFQSSLNSCSSQTSQRRS